MNNEEPIAYILTEIPNPNDLNIAIVEGEVYDEAIIINYRTKMEKLREKYFKYIVILSLFSLIIVAYIIIIITLH